MAIESSASRRTHEVQKYFLEVVQAFWIFRFSLSHSITAERKKEFWKKLCFTLNRGILLVSLVMYGLIEVGIILDRYFRHLHLKILKKQLSFLYHLLFSKVSKPSSSYSFSLDIPLTVPVIANSALYWIESSFWWNGALYAWSYMMSPQSRWGLIKDL